MQHCSAQGMYLRKEAYEAFKEMYTAAKKDGVTLRIISATRNFEAQKNKQLEKLATKTLEEQEKFSKLKDKNIKTDFFKLF